MADTVSLFTTGDVVLANPKESAALFCVVVVLSVILENVFGAFRENRSRYVKLLFLQISEEIMIIGSIGLLFVFVTQTIDNMPIRWLLLFRWVQTVLFFLVVFFMSGIVLTAFTTKLLIRYFIAEERAAQNLLAQQELMSPGASPAGSPQRHGGTKHVTMPEGLDMSALQRAYFILRSVFADQLTSAHETERMNHERQMRQLRSRDGYRRGSSILLPNGATAGAGGASPMGGADGQDNTPGWIAHIPDVTLVDYLQLRSQDVMVKFTDVTWQCWLSIVFLTSFNSIRMFALPGKLQSKPVDEYTLDDRMLNTITYIFIVGWIPMSGFLFAVASLFRNLKRYLARITGQDDAGDDAGPQLVMRDEDPSGAADDGGSRPKSARGRLGGNNVWLPPKQLAEQLLGYANEDPSLFLLRGNRAFTMHCLKVPALLSQLYTAMFVVGQWGKISSTFGVRQVYVIPLALLPIIVVFAILPAAITVVTALTSLGTRIDTPTIARLAKRRERRAQMGGGGGDGDDADSEADDDEANAAAMLARATSDAVDNTAMFERLDRIEHLVQSSSNRDRTTSFMSSADSERTSSTEMVALRARCKFLEDLCVSYGLPIVGRDDRDEADGDEPRSGARGGSGNEVSLAAVCVSLARLQEQTARIAEQQQLLASHQQRVGGGLGNGGASTARDGATDAASTVLAATAASRQLASNRAFNVHAVATNRPNANQMRDLSRLSSAGSAHGGGGNALL